LNSFWHWDVGVQCSISVWNWYPREEWASSRTKHNMKNGCVSSDVPCVSSMQYHQRIQIAADREFQGLHTDMWMSGVGAELHCKTIRKAKRTKKFFLKKCFCCKLCCWLRMVRERAVCVFDIPFTKPPIEQNQGFKWIPEVWGSELYSQRNKQYCLVVSRIFSFLFSFCFNFLLWILFIFSF